MNPIRHQPPVHSPLSAGTVLAAARERGDARAGLQAVLCEAYAAREVRLFGSGTQALQRALELAAAGAGGRAVAALPAYTCPDVASAAIGAGLRIALYDVDPRTFAPDAASLEAVLSAGAGIVVVAPLFGVPIDIDALTAQVRGHGAVLVEDAAQGHGARWRGRPLGSLAERSIISFGRGKGWTGGLGGALLLRGEAPAGPEPADTGGGAGTLVRALAQAVLARPAFYRLPRGLPFLGLGQTRYHAPLLPGAIPRRAAALVLAGRRAAELEAQVRRRHAAELLSALADLPALQTPRVPSEGEAGWLRLPVLVPGGWPGLPSPAAALRLGMEAGYPRALGDWPEVRPHLEYPIVALPGAQRLVRELITLPTHSLLHPEEHGRIVELLHRAYSEAR